MKQAPFFLVAATLALACARPGHAQSISLEDDAAWKPASAAVTQAVKKYDPAGLTDCLPLQMTAALGATSGYRLVTTNSKCWGSAAGPVWLVSTTATPKVVLSDGGFNIDISAAKEPEPEVQIQYGNAGSCGIRVWRYNASKAKYTLKKTIRCL